MKKTEERLQELKPWIHPMFTSSAPTENDASLTAPLETDEHEAKLGRTKLVLLEPLFDNARVQDRRSPVTRRHGH